jgi:hypothetical protein
MFLKKLDAIFLSYSKRPSSREKPERNVLNDLHGKSLLQFATLCKKKNRPFVVFATILFCSAFFDSHNERHAWMPDLFLVQNIAQKLGYP